MPIPHDRVLAALAAWRIDATSLAVLPHGASSEVFCIDVGGRRLVARYAYMEQRDVEPGLLA